MNSNVLYKVAKYIIYAIVLFGLFRYVPEQPISIRDIGTIIIIVLLINLILEYLCDNYLHTKSIAKESKKQRCYCENVENMDSGTGTGAVASVPTPAPTGSPTPGASSSGQAANQGGGTSTTGPLPNSAANNQATGAANASTMRGTHKNMSSTRKGQSGRPMPPPEPSEDPDTQQPTQPATPPKTGPSYRTPESEYAYEYAIEPEDAEELDTEDMPPVDVLPNSTRAKWLKFEKERRKQRPEVQSNIVQDEMKYSIYRVADKPLGDNDAYKDYEYGYSFMPPSNWYPPPERPPVCVTENRCPVCPSLTTGSPVNMKEFDASRRITPPDTISDAYREEKLNSGR